MDDGTNHFDIAGDTDTGPSAPGTATNAVTPRAHQKARPARAHRAISGPAEIAGMSSFPDYSVHLLSWSGRSG